MFYEALVNKNSKIATLIFENSSNWKELLEEKAIRFHSKENRWIFNYESINCDYNDPVVQEARGIILEIDEEVCSISVVCWPFRKFGNYQEGYVDEIDWATARVQEKVDGSIVKLYYYKEKWVWATNGMIEAEDAPTYNGNFKQLILSCSNYKSIPFEKLDKNVTYIFELTSKGNKVVIDYEIERLYHLGARNNVTGKEFEVDLGIIKPKSYPLSSLEECIEAANSLNVGENITDEGYVVVDKDYHRIKIKSPAYISMHHMITGVVTKKFLLNAIMLNLDVTGNFRSKSDEVMYFYYKYKYEELVRDVQDMLYYTRGLYEEYEHDRKAVALQISKLKYATIGFKGIGNNVSAEEFLKDLPYSFLDKAIEDYKHKKIWE